ncbi:CDC48-associated ubiquitin-like/zinc finger protein 1 [Candida viswanathii]|uniref:CDC48-associated ubiquitin-like/zinc finger protein 1 n=1 Tax=Candida viswanathii TaxID=5486 RepID=A0A367XSZ2_9ASCO|nr:CDC48-associated ubiquitin-like/zinc finger protein 1 [Candida viswanathii]
MSSATNLFIDKAQQPNQDNHGVMNLGKNCQYCNQLDFLPFVCEFCNKTFCSNHRTIEQHNCTNKDKFYNQHTRSPSPTSGVSSKTLFPDREADKKKLEASLNNSTVRPTTIKETHFRVGDVAGTNAFKKFQKFLSIQKNKKKSSSSGSGSSSLGKLFGKSKTSTSTSNKYVDIANLKKNAKGDTKIKLEDKIFIWCVYVKNPEDDSINVEKDKKPVFVNKNWVVGRSLDSIADTLHIQNNNNVTSNSLEKLNIFKLEQSAANPDGEPKLISTSVKSTAFKTGDTIYLVRGTI